MSDVLTFNDLLSGVPRRGTFGIDGIGRVALTALTGAESEQLKEEAQQVPDKDPEANNAFMARWAVRLVKGSEPTDEDIAAFRKNYTPDVILEIYKKGLVFNLQAESPREAIEKN